MCEKRNMFVFMVDDMFDFRFLAEKYGEMIDGYKSLQRINGGE